MTDLKLSFDSISRIDRPSLVSQLATVARVASRLGGCDCSRRPCIDHKNRRCPATSYKLYEDILNKNTLKTHEGINYFLFLITDNSLFYGIWIRNKAIKSPNTLYEGINNFILPRMFGYRASSITAEQQRMEQQLATTKVPSYLAT